MMKQFDYIIIAEKFEKKGTIYKDSIHEVYDEISKVLEDRKFKEVKVEIKEREENE